MKLAPLIRQFWRFLPKYTNKFTDEFEIQSITSVGSLVSVVTTTDYVFGNLTVWITEVFEAVSITGFSYDEDTGIIEVTTSQDAGLVESMNIKTRQKSPVTVDLINNTNTALNGTFTVLTAKRTTFTFQFLKDQVGVTLDGQVINYVLTRVGGLHTITVVNSNTFTYDVGEDLGDITIGSLNQMVVRGNIRISGAADNSRAQDSYTAKTEGTPNSGQKFWLFLTYGSVNASKNRAMKSDATSQSTSGSDPRQHVLEQFNAVIFAPTVKSISGLPERDEIENIKLAIYRTILNFTADNPYAAAANENYNYIFISGTDFVYEKAYLAYQLTYEISYDVTFNDMFTDSPIFPFRDIEGTIDINKKGGLQWDFDIDLDDQPL